VRSAAANTGTDRRSGSRLVASQLDASCTERPTSGTFAEVPNEYFAEVPNDYDLGDKTNHAFGVVGEGRKMGPRVQSFVRGCIYAFFAFSAFKLLAHSAGKSQARQQQDWTAKTMAHAGGRLLVGAVGAVVIIAGLVLVREGITRKFEKYLELRSVSASTQRLIVLLGVVGTVARGAVFTLSGIFIVRAALTYDATKARGLDGALRSLVTGSGGPWLLQSWNDVTQVGSHAAETYTVIVVAVVFFLGLRVVLGRWGASLFVAVAVIGEVAIFVCVTLVIDRPRPQVPHLDSAPPTSSFPSGHVAAAVALYEALAVVVWSSSRHGWLRAVAVLIGIGVPIIVGWSRLYRGMHYPTDVFGGGLLGVVWLTAATMVLVRPRR
jgi:membrane-associated phospholipid phosphatase